MSQTDLEDGKLGHTSHPKSSCYLWPDIVVVVPVLVHLAVQDLTRPQPHRGKGREGKGREGKVEGKGKKMRKKGRHLIMEKDHSRLCISKPRTTNSYVRRGLQFNHCIHCIIYRPSDVVQTGFSCVCH